MRCAKIDRKTAETDISVSLNIDGVGSSEVSTGCGFLDHMLVLFAKHSRMDITIKCVGDTYVDYHHTTEDVGIALGKALASALATDGAMCGIKRYGDTTLPMDEALILTALDVSGRAHLEYSANIPAYKVGDFDTELCEEFFAAFVREAGITLHIRQLAGRNSHHIIEGIFKSVARSLAEALTKDSRYSDIPSTKGIIG
ncbi:MAG: imidazoleglycerol-phosphate dehydratase HisB [Clostridia bacterium]|nr:imidazoleglycerol-phosphate dehydratase HisB [Clostridia bacterium]